MEHITVEHATDVAALCGLSSPLWLGSFSFDAQLVLVLLSILWLGLQITFKLQDRFRKKN